MFAATDMATEEMYQLIAQVFATGIRMVVFPHWDTGDEEAVVRELLQVIQDYK